jgi:hypothetical protein
LFEERTRERCSPKIKYNKRVQKWSSISAMDTLVMKMIIMQVGIILITKELKIKL